AAGGKPNSTPRVTTGSTRISHQLLSTLLKTARLCFKPTSTGTKPATMAALGKASSKHQPSFKAVPYRGDPLPNVVGDLTLPGIITAPKPFFSAMYVDELLWVSEALAIDFRPLILLALQG
ncbi:uncharacterized protein BCR38DRAFT_496352, partial [Pseudomassariella vexata]